MCQRRRSWCRAPSKSTPDVIITSPNKRIRQCLVMKSIFRNYDPSHLQAWAYCFQLGMSGIDLHWLQYLVCPNNDHTRCIQRFASDILSYVLLIYYSLDMFDQNRCEGESSVAGVVSGLLICTKYRKLATKDTLVVSIHLFQAYL